MAVSPKYNLKQKGKIYFDIIYVNKAHIYSMLVIFQSIKHGVERNPPLTIVTFEESVREWDPGDF